MVTNFIRDRNLRAVLGRFGRAQGGTHAGPRCKILDLWMATRRP